MLLLNRDYIEDSFADIFRSCGIDWAKTITSWDSGQPLEYHYEVSPITFLKFAYRDLQNYDDYGIVNAITNAKRAIDCEVDKFINCIGYVPKKLPATVREFNKRYTQLYGNIAVKPKFILLRALGIAPITLISQMRDVRNLLEHEYQLSEYSKALEAVEIAELFVGTVDNALNNFRDLIYISNDKNSLFSPSNNNFLKLSYNDGTFTLNLYVSQEKKSLAVNVRKTEGLYLELLRFVFAVGMDRNIDFALWDLLNVTGIEIQQSQVITRNV